MTLMRRAGLLISLIVLTTLSTLAQEGGQFCLRAFEDRNGNGVLDGSEPTITRGVGATLMNANGVIIDSAIMSESPTAARGVICFTGLQQAQYTLMVSAADFVATTADNMTVTVLPDEQPPVLEFGGQRVTAPVMATDDAATSATDEDKLLERAIVAGVATSIVMFVMLILGFFIYLIFLRRSHEPAYPVMPPDDMYRRPPPSSQGIPPVPPSDTGRYPPQR